MFESLSERLQNVVSNIKSKGIINEDNISDIVREIRLCLLEADVNVKIVKEFIANVKEKALGEEVKKSLKPGEVFVKIVKDELVELLGGQNEELNLKGNPAVLMLVGLQGSGKTTTIAKIANMLRKKEHKKPLLVACDIYRPAAIDQLKQLGRELNIEVYYPEPIYCTDNGAMIAASGYYNYISGITADLKLNAIPNLKIGEKYEKE